MAWIFSDQTGCWYNLDKFLYISLEKSVRGTYSIYGYYNHEDYITFYEHEEKSVCEYWLKKNIPHEEFL